MSLSSFRLHFHSEAKLAINELDGLEAGKEWPGCQCAEATIGRRPADIPRAGRGSVTHRWRKGWSVSFDLSHRDSY